MSDWFQFIIIVLASFRLTRLIVYDKITEFLRRPFHETIVETLPDGTTEEYIEIKGSGIRFWIGELLSCHWCTGIWSAAFIYISQMLYPQIANPFIYVFAIAGGAAIVQILSEKD